MSAHRIVRYSIKGDRSERNPFGRIVRRLLEQPGGRHIPRETAFVETSGIHLNRRLKGNPTGLLDQHHEAPVGQCAS